MYKCVYIYFLVKPNLSLTSHLNVFVPMEELCQTELSKKKKSQLRRSRTSLVIRPSISPGISLRVENVELPKVNTWPGEVGLVSIIPRPSKWTHLYFENVINLGLSHLPISALWSPAHRWKTSKVSWLEKR